MKKLALSLFLLCFFLPSHLKAQSCTNVDSSDINKPISIYTPSTFCTNGVLDGANGTLTFVIKPYLGFTITFDNLSLKNFDKVIFKVENAAKIHLKNSIFENVNKVEFQYKRESLLYNSYTTEYFIVNNKFDNKTNFQSIHTTVLNFKAIEGESITHRLDNVNIVDNKFYIGNNSSQCPSSSSCNGKVAAIGMNRETDNQHIKNIHIKNNKILMEGRRVKGIDFAHDFEFDDGRNHYNMLDHTLFGSNKNIIIENNELRAESSSPHYGIMIQGPYKNVNIRYNIVHGFGLASIKYDENNKPYVEAEGSIELYGARKGSNYSHNIIESKVEFNDIISHSTGVRVTGGRDINIYKNTIEVKSWPDALDLNILDDHDRQNAQNASGIAVGHPENSKTGYYYRGENIFVDYNYINMNNIIRNFGISLNQSKNFRIKGNSIENLKSIGIFTYINSPNNGDMGIGESSSIIDNKLDYELNPESENIAGGTLWVGNAEAIVLRNTNALINNPDTDSLKICNNTVEVNNTSNYSHYSTVWKQGIWDNVHFSSCGSNNSINVVLKNEHSSAIRHVASGDFDGDGIDEYVIRNNDNEYFVIFTDDHNYPNFDVQHWSPIPIFWGDSNYESKLKTGDINGDGKDDLIFLNKGNDGKFRLRVALSTGGSFQQFRGYNFPSFFDSYPYLSMAVGNFNSDNEDEIAIRTPNNLFYIIHLNNGSLSRYNVWEDPNISGDSWYEPYMESGDFNNDGYDDLYFLRRSNNGNWFVRVMVYDPSQNGFDGQSGFSQTTLNNIFGYSYSNLGFAVADFDGDNKADVALRHPADKYYVVSSNGSQLTSMELWKNGYIMWGDSNHPVHILPGNIDGNNRKDLFVWSQSNAGTYYFRAAKSQSNSGDKFHRFNGWLINFDSNGGSQLTPSKLNPGSGEDDDKVSEIPEDFQLLQNYPNPFNPVTTISYSIPKRTEVKLEVFDIQGRIVKTLVNEIKAPGTYSVSLNASNLSSGIYFYRLLSGNFTETKKLTLIK